MNIKTSNILLISLVLQFTWGGFLFPAESKNRVELLLKVFPAHYTLMIDKVPAATSPAHEHYRKASVEPGNYLLTLTAEGYLSKTLFVQAREKTVLLEEKLEKADGSLCRFALLKTGRQPKSVIFSPKGDYIITALLDGTGIEVFSAADYTKIREVAFPEPLGGKRGFVEMAILLKRNELWVSQMTTGMVHAVSLDTFQYLYSIPTEGLWSKVIVVNYAETTAYVSNWESRDISVIDIENRKVTGRIPVGGIPRGMAFSADNRFLYVCLYDTGDIEKIDLLEKKVTKTIRCGGGSKRHILLEEKTNRFFVSDMYWGSVFVLSGDNDTIIQEIKVDHNPNTIALTSDGGRLYISSRGPNHADTYLRKGPRFGKIYILNTDSLTIEEWLWGQNQPTGLALSPDNSILAFSNFLDASIEIYWTGRDY